MRPATAVCLALALSPVSAAAEEPPAWAAPWRGGEVHFVDDLAPAMRTPGLPAEPSRPRLVKLRVSFVPALVRAAEDI